MKSFQIRKWQDNYAQDCAKLPDKDENLVNAVLECANQLAEINEKLFDPDRVLNSNVAMTGEVAYKLVRELKSLGGSLFGISNKAKDFTLFDDRRFIVRIFGIKIFSIEPWYK